MAENNNPIKYSDLVKPDDSIEKLIEQLEELTKVYSEAIKKIKGEAIQLAGALQNVSGATEEGREATKRAAAESGRLEKAQRELNFAEGEAAKKLAELSAAKREANQMNKLIVKLNNSAEGSYNRLSAQYSLNKIAINGMTQAERDEAEAKEGLITKTREMYEEMKRLQKETGKNQLNVGNYTEASDAIIAYSDRLKNALHLNGAFGESLLAVGKGGEESRAMFAALGQGITALGKTLMGLMANPVFLAFAGIAAAGTAFKWFYDYNAGLVEATRLTKEFTGKSGDDMRAYRNEVIAISEVYGKDFKETLATADALASQFGISFEEALAAVKGGFIAGADLNGDFLSKMQKYPAVFREAGLSASEFAAVMAQTRSGIFGDAGLDAIKQANARIREMTNTTAAALDRIGISSTQVQVDLQTGAKSTFDVLQEVAARLAELPDSSQEVGETLMAVFGEQGRDAGLAMIRSLKDIETNLDVVKEQTGEYGKLEEELIASQLEMNNTLSAAFDVTGGWFERMTTNAKIFANKAITAVVRGLIDTINYFRNLYNESEVIRVSWEGVVFTFRTGIDIIGNLFGALIDVIKATGRALKGAFTLDFSEIKAGMADYASALGKLVKTQINDTVENYRKGVEDMNKKIDPLTLPVQIEGEDTGGKNGIIRSLEEAQESIDTANDKLKEAKEKTAEELLKIEQKEHLRELELQKKAIELRLAAVEKGSEEERRLRLQLLEAMEAEEQYKNKIDGGLSESDISAKYRKQAEQIQDEYLRLQLVVFEQNQKLAQSEFDLLQTTEERKTQFKLQAEKVRLQKLLEINEQANKKLSDAEVETIRNTIARIEQEIEDSQQDEHNKDIYSLFGLNLGDEQKQAINDSVSFAIGQLNEFLAARVASADKAVESANREVDSAQRALDAELQARANGYANNVEMAQKELNEAKKNQEKALKEQQKAQRQQQTMQSLQQVGNLVTASSKIWAQLGFPFAIPALSVMWGSFAATKIKAAQMTRSEKYADGTVELLKGGSHQSGDDVDLGTKTDGTRRRAEGGEYFAVINKRSSRRYRHIIPDVINQLNRGTYMQNTTPEADGLTINVGGQPSELRGLTEDVRAIRDASKKKTYTDGTGNTIVEYKNLKRKIKG